MYEELESRQNVATARLEEEARALKASVIPKEVSDIVYDTVKGKRKPWPRDVAAEIAAAKEAFENM